jgi:imidazolonepropionase-like amidohydrolase
MCSILVIACGLALSSQPRALVLTRVNVVDVETGSVMRGMTVVVVDGRITAVDASASARVPAGAETVDGAGKYLIPGLWDMHVHWYDERFLPLFIANGVTGVRQMFGRPIHLSWRERIHKGDLIGPRQVVGSTIVDGSPPVWPGSVVLTDGLRAREAVQQFKRDGYDFVKVYTRLPREAYFAILDEAKLAGLPVEGHVPNAVTAAEASDAGQKAIEHMTGVLLSASGAEDEQRRSGQSLAATTQGRSGMDADARAMLRAQRERTLATYDEGKAEALFARFAKNGTWHVPTLTVLRAGASLDDPAFTNDARLKYMPPAIRENWKPQNNAMRSWKTAEDYELDRRTLRLQFKVVGAMQRAGVRLLAGTDVLNPFAFPGFSLHDELTLLVDAGLTPIQALQAATINPARFLGKLDSLGTVATGKTADLVLLDANPLEDIRATTRIAAVILGGRVFNRRTLDSMLGDAEKTAKSAPAR